MCDLCKHFFADPESDESMPISIGDDTVITYNNVVLARLNVSCGFTNSFNDLSNQASRIIAELDVGDGETVAHVDIPIKFCPFCGAELPQGKNE